VDRLFPEITTMAPEEIYSDLSFPRGPEDRPYVVINMITTVDGKATNLAGTVATLGSRVDRTAMRRIRVATDGVMNGAETLRRENVNPTVPEDLALVRRSRGLSPQPIALTITGSGNLSLERSFFTEPPERVVVATNSTPLERVETLSRHAKVIRAGDRRVDLPLMMRLLVEELGIRTLVVEGGPTLNSELISLGLADELFWTISPKILGGPAERTMVEESPLTPGERPNLELLSIHRHESELYLRYRFGIRK
jgi:riboflavin-specific deaminase-like protein